MQKRLYAALAVVALCALLGCRTTDDGYAYIRLNTETSGLFALAKSKITCSVNGVAITAGKEYIAVRPNGVLDTMLMGISVGDNDIDPPVNLLRLQARHKYEVTINGLALYYLYNIRDKGVEGSPLGAVRFYYDDKTRLKIALDKMCDTLTPGDTSVYYKDAPPVYLGKTGYALRFIDAKGDTLRGEYFFHFLDKEKMLCSYDAGSGKMSLQYEGQLSERDKTVTRTDCRFEQ
jgi:hypothetical protein